MKDLSQESPLRFEAAPFYPHMLSCAAHPLLEFAIYNDGKPMATCEAKVSEILHGIQDDALDEGFPPDAQDAAELEEMDTFNEMQALLALLEERDEQARSGFCHIKKRWEVRRREGLAMGHKPRAASNKMVDPSKMHAPRLHAATSHALVPHAHHCHKLQDKAMHQQQRHLKDLAAMQGMMGRTNNKAMIHHGSRQIPIQQPRKQN